MGRQKVVIIGHGYTSRLGIIRSLAELDCEITVIAMVFHNWFGRFIRFDWGKPIDCYSKYVNTVLYCYAKDGEGLVSLLLQKCTDQNQKVIVIPDSDFSAMVIDKNLPRLQDFFLFPHIHHEQGAVEKWMDKEKQKSLAREVGLNVANSRIVDISGGKYEIPDIISYPCFTKPVITIVGGKQYFKRCNTKDELIKSLDFASREKNIQILVEDFKEITTEYAVLGFSDGNNVVIPGIIEFIVNSLSHFGIAREGKIMPISGFESLMEQFKDFVRRIGFCGLFDIDFYESDGKMYFGEMNLRFGGSGYAVTKQGVNLPAMFVRSLLGVSVCDLQKDVKGTAPYVNERRCLDDWSYGFISKKECFNIIQKREIKFIYDDMDFAPQCRLNSYIKFLSVKKELRKIQKYLCNHHV